MTTDVNMPPGQYLSFRLGDETFAVGILSIKEILEYQSITEVPMMVSHVRGVINLRGAAVPVMDLMGRFGKTSSPVSKRTCIVIVEVASSEGNRVIGIVVDAVYEVVDIAAADIEPPPNIGNPARREFIEGIGKVNGKFVILLNLGAVFSLQEWEAVAPAA